MQVTQLGLPALEVQTKKLETVEAAAVDVMHEQTWSICSRGPRHYNV